MLPTCDARMHQILSGSEPLRVIFVDNKRFGSAQRNMLSRIVDLLNRLPVVRPARGDSYGSLLRSVLEDHYAARSVLRKHNGVVKRAGVPSAQWGTEDTFVSRAVQRAQIFTDFPMLEKFHTEQQLIQVLDAIAFDVATAGLHLNFNATYVFYSKYPGMHQQLQLMATTDIALVGVGTSMMNSFLHRDGAVLINLQSWNGTVHPDSIRRGQRPWVGEAYVLNVLADHLQVLNYARSAKRRHLSYIPLLRLVVKAILKTIYHSDAPETVPPMSESASILQMQLARSRVSNSILSHVGMCGDLKNQTARNLVKDEDLPIEGLLWKRMCLLDDPDGCAKAVKVLQQGGVGRCFHMRSAQVWVRR
jgi:hypothetical protein